LGPANPVGLTGRAPVSCGGLAEGWGCGLGFGLRPLAHRSSSVGLGGGGSATGPRMIAGGAVGSQDLSPEAAAWATPRNGLSQPFSGRDLGFRCWVRDLALSSQSLPGCTSAFVGVVGVVMLDCGVRNVGRFCECVVTQRPALSLSLVEQDHARAACERQQRPALSLSLVEGTEWVHIQRPRASLTQSHCPVAESGHRTKRGVVVGGWGGGARAGRAT
jgi:hypothetical protein